MKLIDFIEFLLHPEKIEEFIPNEEDMYEVSIYMKESLNLDSDISFFKEEETEDNVLFEKDGVNYIQLFPVGYAIELIEEDLNLKNKGYSNLQIAQRLLDYRIKDA